MKKFEDIKGTMKCKFDFREKKWAGVVKICEGDIKICEILKNI